MFFWIKIIHVISSAILFGTGMGTALYMFCVNRQDNIELIARATKQVVFVDWVFTGSSAIIQFITGIILITLKGYSPFSFWIVGSVMGYVIAALCWFPVVYFQMRCRDLAFEALANKKSLPEEYARCYRAWWILGIPAFLALMGVFYLMVNRPI